MRAHRYKGCCGTLLILAALALMPLQAQAQAGRGARAQAGPPPWSKQLPGYWVSLITENWRLRMVTPSKGDYIGIPLTAAAAKIADAWDPAKDEAAGMQCRGYGAGIIMTRPERLHIQWQDDNTLQMDVDGGTQTRVFHFGAGAVPADFQPSWQGYSRAAWVPRRSEGYGQVGPNARALRVMTTHMLSGYLRQNGVPYSENAVLTEYYDMIPASEQEQYLVVTTSMDDPVYLDYPLVLSSIFQQQADGAKWHPTACSASW